MKRNWMVAALLLLFVNANALIVNIDGHGDIPEGGMEITVTDAELDILSGKMQMKLQGSLLCTAPLTVQITRSETGLEDEFCCAGNCLSGNGETAQTLNYSPEGIASWFVHYTPVADSNETMTYVFTDATESRTLTVHFQYSTEGMDNGQRTMDNGQWTKVLRDGQLYLMHKGQMYDVQGKEINK